MTTASPLKVLYVMGFTRTGGTLLGRLLGEVDGVFCAGGLRHLWNVGVLEDRRCSCGRRFGACEVWPRAMAAAFGDRVAWPDARQVVRWEREVLRTRHIPRLLRQPRHRPSGWAALDAYRREQARLYRGLRQVTGARVVVDTSRWPAQAAVLPLIDGIEPYVIHLVRDPRAVAYSWQRRKPNPDLGRREEFRRFRPRSVSVGYAGYNAVAEAVCHRYGDGRSLRVRYEDFVERPEPTLRRVLHLVGERGERLPVRDGRAELGVNHMVTGNPNRFERGPITLTPDDEWISHQPRPDRTTVTALTLPLLIRYGYPLRVQS